MLIGQKKNILFVFFIILLRYIEVKEEASEVYKQDISDKKSVNEEFIAIDKKDEAKEEINSANENREIEQDNENFGTDEGIFFGDSDVDISKFKRYKLQKNFFRFGVSGGLNIFTITEKGCLCSKWKGINWSLNSVIKYPFQSFLLNKNYSLEGEYNIRIRKGFNFYIGVKFYWRWFFFGKFLDNEYSSVKNYQKSFPGKDELNQINTELEGQLIFLNSNKNKSQIKNRYEQLENKKKKLEENQKNFDRKSNECGARKNFYSISLFSIGTPLGFVWYSNSFNLSKSWHVKIGIFIGYQRLHDFKVFGKAKVTTYGNEGDYFSSISINHLNLSWNFEVGKGKISGGFFGSLLPLIRQDSRKCNENIEKTDGKYISWNLHHLGFYIKYNVF